MSNVKKKNIKKNILYLKMRESCYKICPMKSINNPDYFKIMHSVPYFYLKRVLNVLA